MKRNHRHKQVEIASKTLVGAAPTDASSTGLRPPTPASTQAPMPIAPLPVVASGASQKGRAPAVPWLDRLVDGSEAEGYPLTKEITSIGRDPTNDICLGTANGVSRFHARILRQDDGHFLLADLNSSNGTFLNGVRLFEPASLKYGDQIEIGNARFAFYV